jgi:Stage II sporulation protein E (SpoIIE)
MPNRDAGHLELRSLLAAVEAAPPVAAVDVFAAELGKRLAAQQVVFLIADVSGDAVVRLSHNGAGAGHRSQGADAAETVPLAGTPYEHVMRSQRLQVAPVDDGCRVLAPVTDRGDVIGVLEMLLPAGPDPDTVDYIAAAAHALGYVVIVNRRFTDLFEWGQRSKPFSLAAEIQRRLLPTSLTCEAGQFTIAGAVEPSGMIGGDTFDYSLDRDTLHVSLTDAMGHEEDAALLATLLVGSLRNSRRAGATLVEQAAQANTAVVDHSRADQFVTGQLLRVDLTTGTGTMVNAGHPGPLRARHSQVERLTLMADPPFGIVPGARYRLQSMPLLPGDRLLLVTDGVLERNATRVDILDMLAATIDLHPREVVQQITRAVLHAVDGSLRDDATVLCLDWYGGGERDRPAGSGANRDRASPPHAAS